LIFVSTYIKELKVRKQTAKNNDPQRHFFRYFSIGAVTFLLGLGTVIYVNLLLPPSAKQEWLALVGLVLGIPGGMIAFYCYIRLLIARFKHFFDS